MQDVAVVQLEAHAAAAEAATKAAQGQAQATPAPARIAFVAVFDGHGGRNAAEFASTHLHAQVMAAGLAAEAQRVGREQRAAASAAGSDQRRGPDGQQRQGQTLPNIRTCKVAITEGFRTCDAAILERAAADNWPDGACAVAAWVVGEVCFVANVGDARAVLARRPLAASGHSEGKAAPAAAAVAAGDPAPAPELKAITLTREHKARCAGV